MKSTTATAILSFTLTTTTLALCPYAERALADPDFPKQHLEERGAPKAEEQHEKRQSGPGNIPFTTFNTNQLIDVTGTHAWVAPGPSDLRGPCPGLNALANHGYFPHSGVVPLAVGASATEQVYGQSPDSSSCHAVLTVARSCCRLWDPLDRVCYTCRRRCSVSDPISLPLGKHKILTQYKRGYMEHWGQTTADVDLAYSWAGRWAFRKP